MTHEQPSGPGRTPSSGKIASRAGVAVGAGVLVCFLALLLFADPLVNRFIKPRVEKALAEEYPDYLIRVGDLNYSIFRNRFGCDSMTISAVDRTLSSTAGPFAVSGIQWMHLLWGGRLGPEDFANSVIDAHNIVLTLHKEQYEGRCTALRVSVPDSEMVVDSLELHPAGDDEWFFAGSPSSRVRIRLIVSRVRVAGVTPLALLQEEEVRARSVRIEDASVDLLTNKYKPRATDTSGFHTPNEILASIGGMLQVDSLRIVNGELRYGERYAIGSEPAVITVDSIQVLAEGSGRGAGAPLVICAEGQLMKAGTLHVLMSIPLGSPELSFRYSGSLSAMDLTALNSFLEPAEQMRVKSGALHEATFAIGVASGRASGTVHAAYSDLVFAVIDKHSGSDAGLVDGISSLVASTFIIRGTNVSNKSGAMKVGKVEYVRKQGEAFIEFAWFALRGGLADIIGF